MRGTMDKSAILQALCELTKSREIQLMLLLEKKSRFSAYEPINKYILDLKNGSKPESAVEDLFRTLTGDVLGLSVQPQVKTVHGFVDFAVAEGGAEPVMVEVKPLFELYNDERLASSILKPATHLDQVKKYLRKHEYV